MYLGIHTHTHTQNYSNSLKAKESVVCLPPPISLYQRAALSMFKFFLLSDFPVAAVAANNGSNKAFVVEDV